MALRPGRTLRGRDRVGHGPTAGLGPPVCRARGSIAAPRHELFTTWIPKLQKWRSDSVPFLEPATARTIAAHGLLHRHISSLDRGCASVLGVNGNRKLHAFEGWPSALRACSHGSCVFGVGAGSSRQMGHPPGSPGGSRASQAARGARRRRVGPRATGLRALRYPKSPGAQPAGVPQLPLRSGRWRGSDPRQGPVDRMRRAWSKSSALTMRANTTVRSSWRLRNGRPRREFTTHTHRREFRDTHESALTRPVGQDAHRPGSVRNTRHSDPARMVAVSPTRSRVAARQESSRRDCQPEFDWDAGNAGIGAGHSDVFEQPPQGPWLVVHRPTVAHA